MTLIKQNEISNFLFLFSVFLCDRLSLPTLLRPSSQALKSFGKMAPSHVFETHLAFLKEQFDADLVALRELHGVNSAGANHARMALMIRLTRYEQLITRFERYVSLLDSRILPPPPPLQRQDGFSRRRPLADITNVYHNNDPSN